MLDEYLRNIQKYHPNQRYIFSLIIVILQQLVKYRKLYLHIVVQENDLLNQLQAPSWNFQNILNRWFRVVSMQHNWSSDELVQDLAIELHVLVFHLALVVKPTWIRNIVNALFWPVYKHLSYFYCQLPRYYVWLVLLSELIDDFKKFALESGVILVKEFFMSNDEITQVNQTRCMSPFKI